jgi:hypothetical protein
MNLMAARILCVATGAGLCLLAQRASAATDSAPPPTRQTVALHAIPSRVRPSPVEAFRKLLAMTPAERDSYLTNYPAASRTRILEKLQEYEMLPPDFRELRLQVTELRWYLVPLLKASPTDREARLQAVPESCRELVKARLDEWDLWPPALKAEVLEYETTFSRFLGRDAKGNVVVLPEMSADELPARDRPVLERKLARWQAMPSTQREQLYASFEHYFNLNEAEKEKILNLLSEPEREETEKVLDPIDKWSKPQQERYLAAFRQFGDMTSAERDRFMQNVERWKKMSPEERQAWRDLLHQLAEIPPLPPGFAPPASPGGPGLPAGGRTNPTAAPVP